jgi:hypothetical protein
VSADLGFVHVFKPAQNPGAPTLLLLHGTGGDENDMLPLGSLAPGAALLSPRGKVLENGMPRFFPAACRRRVDVEDLKTRRRGSRTSSRPRRPAPVPARVIAMGFERRQHRVSRHPAAPWVLKTGGLFRAMVPLGPDPLDPVRHARPHLQQASRSDCVRGDRPACAPAAARR